MTAPRHLPPEPYGDVLDKALARVAELERENARLREENDALEAGLIAADRLLAGLR